MKKQLRILTLITIFTLAVLTVNSASAQFVTLPNQSPYAQVMQRVGITDVTITYHRPSVNEREIWGGLVPYGFFPNNFGPADKRPWRAGANNSTTIEFTSDVTIEGKPLEKGIYGLFMAVEENGTVTVIFSNNSTAWGSFFYNEEEDALRVEVQSEEADLTELLTYEFTEVTNNSAKASLTWAEKMIPFNIGVDTKEVVYASLSKELQSTSGFSWQGYNQAANYLLQNEIHLAKALEWVDASINAPFFGQKNFTNLSTKAQILSKLEREEEAEKVMDEALKMGTVLQIHGYGRQLISQGKEEKAMEVFKFNANKYPDTWPVNYGLARGYSAQGDFKSALKHLKKAQENLPENDIVNKQALEANLKKLEAGEDIN